MPKKGHKSQAGIGDSYGEMKKDINLTLTPTAIDALAKKAKELGLSRSELVERFARGEFSIKHDEQTNQIFLITWWKLGRLSNL